MLVLATLRYKIRVVQREVLELAVAFKCLPDEICRSLPKVANSRTDTDTDTLFKIINGIWVHLVLVAN